MQLLLLHLLSCSSGFADSSRALGPPVPADAPRWPEDLHLPPGLGRAQIEARDATGQSLGVACVTCHGPTPSTAWVASVDGAQPHPSVVLRHGRLSCASCHDPDDRTRLRLADGQLLDFDQTLELCSQCHGSQRRSFDHRAHGGARGAWDTRRGGRERQLCVACHDPHGPAFPLLSPVFPPRDRYLGTEPHQEKH